jgi:hypothetical protein
MYSVFAPVFWSHFLSSLATNSGPLSVSDFAIWSQARVIPGEIGVLQPNVCRCKRRYNVSPTTTEALARIYFEEAQVYQGNFVQVEPREARLTG